MPFEVMLVPSHRAAPVERKNPFTGEPAIVEPIVMTDAEHAAALELLAAYGGDANGIILDDAAISLGGFDREGTLAGLRGNIDSWAPVLHALASAGNLAIVSVNSAPTFTTSAAVRDRLRRFAEHEAAEVIVVTDASGLADHLRNQYAEIDAWTARVSNRFSDDD